MEVTAEHIAAAKQAGACRTPRLGTNFYDLDVIEVYWFERYCPDLAAKAADEIMGAKTAISLALLADEGYGYGYDGYGYGDGDGDGYGYDGYGYGYGHGDGHGHGYGHGDVEGDGDGNA